MDLCWQSNVSAFKYAVEVFLYGLCLWGFPSSLNGKKICLQCSRPGFNPCVRKIPWRRALQPTPVFLPGEFHGQRSLSGYTVHEVEKSRTQLSNFHFLGSFMSCLRGLSYSKVIQCLPIFSILFFFSILFWTSGAELTWSYSLPPQFILHIVIIGSYKAYFFKDSLFSLFSTPIPPSHYKHLLWFV